MNQGAPHYTHRAQSSPPTLPERHQFFDIRLGLCVDKDSQICLLVYRNSPPFHLLSVHLALTMSTFIEGEIWYHEALLQSSDLKDKRPSPPSPTLAAGPPSTPSLSSPLSPSTSPSSPHPPPGLYPPLPSFCPSSRSTIRPPLLPLLLKLPPLWIPHQNRS